MGKAPITNGSPVYCSYQEVTITPPKGYKFIEKMSSFVHNDKNTSISVVSKSSISYQGYIDAILNSDVENAKLVEKKQLEKGWLVVFEFDIQGKTVQRMMYITGNEKKVVYAMANYLKKQRLVHYASLKSALLSIQYDG